MDFFHNKIIEAIVILIFIGFCQLIIITGLSYLEGIGRKERRAKITHVFKLPLSFLLWFFLGIYCLQTLAEQLNLDVAETTIHGVRKSGVFACGVWIFFRWKNALEKTLLARPPEGMDPITIQLMSRLMTVAAILSITLVFLPMLGVNTTPLLAIGSVGAASLGLAAKDIIANFCTGIFISLVKPFRAGDEILLPEKNIGGKVEEIGWFSTSICSRKGHQVYFPNNIFSTFIVTNISKQSYVPFVRVFTIDQQDMSKVLDVTKAIKAHLISLDWISTAFPTEVYLKSFSGTGADIELQACVKDAESDELVKHEQDLLLQLHAIFKKFDVALARPYVQIIH